MKQLQYVAVLSKYGNFTRAAEEIGISQPALSQYIKKIEREIGTPLFVRAGQNVRLTDAGQVYLEIGQKMLNLENEMDIRLSDILNDQTGTMRIGIAPYRCTSLMPGIIKEFHRSYPQIKILISEQITTDLKKSAERGEVDLCVSTLPIDQRKFQYKTVMQERTVLAIPKNICSELAITAEPRSCISMVQLKKVPFISLPETQIMGRKLVEIYKKCGIDPNITVECQDLIAVRSMVKSGLGAAILPNSLVNESSCSEVNYYYLKEAEEIRDIVVFYRKEQYLSKPMQKMIEILTTIFKTERQTTL